MLDRKQSKLGTGWGSYTVIMLVSPLGSLTIAKFNDVSVHCFVVALFSALYVYYILLYILSVYYCTWTIYVNVTILRKYSGNTHACTTSRYQAVFLLPRGLGTRLITTCDKFTRSFPSTSRSTASNEELGRRSG